MFGWAVVSDGPDVVVLDDNGTWQARFRRSDDAGARAPVTGRSTGHRLERGTTSTLWLPDGPVDVFNGRPFALRRRSQVAQAMVGDHLYDFRPDSSRWSHLMRDGWSIARLHRSGRGASEVAEVMTFGDLDPIDRLMVVLGQECIGPGRPGFVVALARLAVATVGDLTHRRRRYPARGAGQNRSV